MNPDSETEFLRTYKDFIYHFNMLDQNIACCLRYCSRKTGSQNPEKWLSSSFDSKIKKIIALAQERGIHDTFSDWHAQVDECRHLRNIISHGNWEWRWSRPSPIFFHAPQIENGKGTFTTLEFKKKLIHLKHVADTFDKIRTPLEIAIVKAAQAIE